MQLYFTQCAFKEITNAFYCISLLVVQLQPALIAWQKAYFFFNQLRKSREKKIYIRIWFSYGEGLRIEDDYAAVRMPAAVELF